ncbi:MAG TPA: CotH kinase family protein, partial [Vicinamibacterales bacterium]|nr:CotH kinase family protein [Vicinamibacterales bacterium]
GIRLTSSEVTHYPDAPLYDAATLRTFFIEFENPEWEAELVAFNNTDVDVPATVTVDGRVYRDVGIHFRGNSSFGVGNGYKRSLNLSFDFVHENQAIGGYRTLNFLNANADPTLMRTVLSMHIARQYIAAPRANFVRVVINGENWGVYANAQQFNKEFVADNFGTTKGARWKISQASRGGGGFTYQGDDPGRYRGTFQIKSKDEPEAWAALIDLAKTLDTAPAETLEAALASRIDIDAYLRFLALDNIMNSADAFYQRVADYSLYRDPGGKFHFVFHDANEMFSMGGRGLQLSPLVAENDTNKPIIAKVLAVPAFRTKYLAYLREIAEKSLDWNAIGPIVRQYSALIADDVARDTRKLFSTEEFVRTTADDPAMGTLRSFFEGRRAFLLQWFADNAAPIAAR